ncbi:unnamed protein product [Cuscuta epithymum]|uniref:ATP-dependent DNA helicase n=1 Tax=Cuscuta epithymum TaxID=186058 RepID=A0AAV0EQN0_9ASTE|nr:unnamed protein product [Cuscuta epithymum]
MFFLYNFQSQTRPTNFSPKENIVKQKEPNFVYLSKEGEHHPHPIVSTTYPGFLKNTNNISYLEGRAILAPTIDEVDKINDFMLLQNSSKEKTVFSSDSACSPTSESQTMSSFKKSILPSSLTE